VHLWEPLEKSNNGLELVFKTDNDGVGDIVETDLSEEHFPDENCQEPTFTEILNFIFQSNSPTFIHSSLFSHDHSSSKQDKTFISDENWYMV